MILLVFHGTWRRQILHAGESSIISTAPSPPSVPTTLCGRLVGNKPQWLVLTREIMPARREPVSCIACRRSLARLDREATAGGPP